MDKNYHIIAFDAQYFLFRNFAALKGRTKFNTVSYLTDEEGDSTSGHIITSYNFDENDLVKQFFWTIAKVVREVASCNKIILLWDLPPYHKTALLPDYKGTRTHHCQEVLDEWDIDNDPVGYLQEKEEYKFELILRKAKYWIIDNLGKFGMPSLIYKGYEADDLAYIFSKCVGRVNGLKSAICSSDSDWLYWITEDTDWINFNQSYCYTYQDGLDECEGKCEEFGISLFDMKVLMDSTFYSHNDLMHTTNLGWKDIDLLWNTLSKKDYTYLTDPDRYEKNVESFQIHKYPNFDDVVYCMNILINQGGQLGTMNVFYELKSKGFSVSYKYAENYLGTLNGEYYGK